MKFKKMAYKPLTDSGAEDKIHEVVLIALVDIFSDCRELAIRVAVDAFEEIDERGQQEDAAGFVRENCADGENVWATRG